MVKIYEFRLEKERANMEISKDIKVAIVGVGSIGASIVQAFAQSEFTVYGIDIDQKNLDRGLKNIEQYNLYHF